MWRSVLVGAALAGVLAGCSWGSGSSHSGSTRLAITAGGTHSLARALVVGCDQVIGRERSGTSGGYRQVLGVISVPAAYIPQVVRVHGEGWPYWEKSGIGVRANRLAVTVAVPSAWRRRAAITWGNGKPAVSVIRFSPCPSPPN